MSDGNEGQLQLDTMPNWLKAGTEPAAPVEPATPPPDPAAAWLAPDDRTAPEPGEPGAAWAGPAAGEAVRPIETIVAEQVEAIFAGGGPDPAPAPIREPGDDPAPADQPDEGEDESESDPRVAKLADGILLFKRLWIWPPNTQNELEAAKAFAAFVVGVIEKYGDARS